MFRKIVSNLPFSPALVGQLGFYAKRLRKEEVTRRLGLFFVILSLIVQSLVVFQPTKSANASSDTDMVNGGISSIEEYLSAYDSNTKYLKDTMDYIGITRNEIANTKYGSWLVGKKLSWGYAPRFSREEGERKWDIPDANGQILNSVYSRPMALWGYSPNQYVSGWIGTSDNLDGGRDSWFGILESCGNLVTNIELETMCPYNPSLYVNDPRCKEEPKCSLDPSLSANDPNCKPCPYNPNILINDPLCTPLKCAIDPNLLADDPNCEPCPGDESILISDPKCIPNIVKSKTGTNISQGFIDSSSKTARTGDQISYTISVENTGLSSTSIKLTESLGDVMEYSRIIDYGGGTFDKKLNILSWSNVTIEPKEKQTRTFVVKVLDTIPATAVGSSDPTSYDCVMINVFGNSIHTKVDCPTPKIVENVTRELPKTGPTENIIFSGLVLAIVTYFYARSRQVKKEVYLVRKIASIGTL